MHGRRPLPRADAHTHLAQVRREFNLLERDERYLDEQSYEWEAAIDGKRRWLLIHGFKLPEGYTTAEVLLALDISPNYPKAEIDMFYSNPPLVLSSGRAIAATQVRAKIFGTEFHGWSRHRSPTAKWKPETDCVATHLALVESAILKEVGQ